MDVVTRDVLLNRDGQVYANHHLQNAHIVVTAANVTIRNVRIDGGNSGDAAWINTSRSRNTLIEHVTVDGHGQSGGTGVWNSNFTCNFCRITGTADGMQVTSNVVVENSWISNLGANSSSAHLDDIQSMGGSDVQIRNNRLDNTATEGQGQTISSIMLGDGPGATNYVVTGNLMSGGGYTLYGGAGNSVNLRIYSNVWVVSGSSFGGRYGPVIYFQPGRPGAYWNNNRLSTGALIPPPKG